MLRYLMAGWRSRWLAGTVTVSFRIMAAFRSILYFCVCQPKLRRVSSFSPGQLNVFIF